MANRLKLCSRSIHVNWHGDDLHRGPHDLHGDPLDDLHGECRDDLHGDSPCGARCGDAFHGDCWPCC